jgi:hypothetical protein
MHLICCSLHVARRHYEIPFFSSRGRCACPQALIPGEGALGTVKLYRNIQPSARHKLVPVKTLTSTDSLSVAAFEIEATIHMFFSSRFLAGVSAFLGIYRPPLEYLPMGSLLELQFRHPGARSVPLGFPMHAVHFYLMCICLACAKFTNRLSCPATSSPRVFSLTIVDSSPSRTLSSTRAAPMPPSNAEPLGT